jgi:hypothetical protein
MNLWILRPVDESRAPWRRWYDRMFGFVIRARSEDAARNLAASSCGHEGPEAWLSSRSSTCLELKEDGPEEVVMENYNATK